MEKKNNRLTRYDDENRYYRPCDYESDKQSTILKLCKKLGQLENIEDELGVDLITLFKALKNGIWSKKGDKIEKIEITDNLRLVLDCNGSTDEINWWLLDYYDMNGNRSESIDNWWVCKYGIEWALTKEELEK